jgi:hypothetical protein
MTIVRLPEQVEGKDLLRLIRNLGAAGNGSGGILVDFERVRWIVPAGMVALATAMRGWHDAGRSVTLRNLDECPVRQYLQRLDFFAACGITADEPFRRHDPGNRFVTLQEVSNKARTNVERVSYDVAHCVAGEEEDDVDWESGEPGAYGFVEFAVSELARNVLQHSRGIGFVAAQHYPTTDLVHFAIADNGIGIRESFRGSTHAARITSDLDAVLKALEPFVSSKTENLPAWGERVNEGVGLPMLKELCASAGGKLLVISGRGVYTLTGTQTLPEHTGFQGTLCALSVRRADAARYTEHLAEARKRLGLSTPPDTFSGVFQ